MPGTGRAPGATFGGRGPRAEQRAGPCRGPKSRARFPPRLVSGGAVHGLPQREASGRKREPLMVPSQLSAPGSPEPGGKASGQTAAEAEGDQCGQVEEGLRCLRN